MADPPRKPMKIDGGRIGAGPLGPNWWGESIPGGPGMVQVRPTDQSKQYTASGYFQSSPNRQDWLNPLLGPGEYLQNREDPQLQEFDLMQAIRDRMLRGQ